MKKALKLLIILLFVGSALYAQDITLKNSFFVGMKYSLDGEHFQKVNLTNLKLIMKENQEAISLLDSYKSYLTVSKILGYPGGFLVGWPIGGYLGGGEWTDSYRTMIAVGAPLAVLSIVFEITANNRLKEAVEKYNSGKTAMLDNIDVKFGYGNYSKGLTLNFTYHF